ncbi:hypothetical protein ADEAN_000118200 [Angomonas deanei]|uniref:Uncharacterized protein n=1 Tax=Angomonas deanei TaxID=59799 RepID=A0A7G2C269_9TRYP|nr:hypothetical protein ADEAN_000118200 [Angomonas deanei]
MSYPTDYRGWLAKLVAFKPVSRDSNLPLIHYVRDYLQTVGIEAVLVHNPEKDQGQPVGHAARRGRRHEGRAGAVRPHRRRAGRRTEVVHGSFRHGGEGWEDLRQRNV